jgi:hypothetical protein
MALKSLRTSKDEDRAAVSPQQKIRINLNLHSHYVYLLITKKTSQKTPANNHVKPNHPITNIKSATSICKEVSPNLLLWLRIQRNPRQAPGFFHLTHNVFRKTILPITHLERRFWKERIF